MDPMDAMGSVHSSFVCRDRGIVNLPKVLMDKALAAETLGHIGARVCQGNRKSEENQELPHYIKSKTRISLENSSTIRQKNLPGISPDKNNKKVWTNRAEH